MATFDLRIAITGLCLLVEDDAGAQVHVLIPELTTGGTGGGGHHGMVPHFAQLAFDPMHLRRPADRPRGQTSEGLVLESLTGYALDLANVVAARRKAGSGAQPWEGKRLLPEEFLHLGELVDGKVPKALVGDLPGPDVSARVTLSIGRATGFLPGSIWLAQRNAGTPVRPQDARPMARFLQWTVSDIEGDSVTLPMKGLNGIADRSIGPLYPTMDTDGRETVSLWVYHVPANELPPVEQERDEPTFGDELPHFTALLPLLKDASGQPVGTPSIRFLCTTDDAPVWPGRRHPMDRSAGLDSKHLALTPSAHRGGGAGCSPPRAELASDERGKR